MTVSPSGMMPQLIVLIGAPGSGKTAWAEAFCKTRAGAGWRVISQADYYTPPLDNHRAISQFLYIIEHALTQRQSIIADGDFVAQESRHSLLLLAKRARYLVKEAVTVSAEPEVALRRYMASEQQRILKGLPAFHYNEHDIFAAIATLQSNPPRLSEGFSALYEGKSGGEKILRPEVFAL